jgi:hypothetical protein
VNVDQQGEALLAHVGQPAAEPERAFEVLGDGEKAI